MIRIDRTVRGLIAAVAVSLPLSAGWCAAPPAASATANSVLISMDQPFLFTYGTWDKHARIENGTALLDGDGITPKGGAGMNRDLDLSAHADDSPVLRLRIGPKNSLKMLRLMLRDTDGHAATWEFPLPAASADTDYVTVTPRDGASFGHPNSTEKNVPLELGKVMQWQITGDWGGDGPVDIRLQSILAVAPTDAVRQQRVAQAKQEAADREQARRDREALRAKYATVGPKTPVVEAVYAAAPDVLAVQIHTGKISPAHLSDYTPQPGDTRRTADGGAVVLIRQGSDVGYLIGPKHDGLVTFEGFDGDPLLEAEADDPANYTVHSTNDPAFASSTAPVSVARKSKPDDWQQPKLPGLTMRHIVYLRLPHPLNPGKSYTLALGAVNVTTPRINFVFDPAAMRSESIHVNQVGFRADDPLKRAYLSLWMGEAGGYAFAEALPFRVVSAATGKTIYASKAGKGWDAATPEKMNGAANFNGTSVYPLDFSAVSTPGKYRVVVDGVGCSYPFEIGPRVWESAFQVQMKGFYNQRSGVTLGPPYTPFRRPRDFFPGDGAPVYQSTYSQLDGGDGQKGLEAHSTGKIVPEAWGGYHDAGDWNPRRITHMRTTTLWQIELMELFPDYFRGVALNIPKTSPAPDLLNEVRFELDLFRRLQLSDGGVRFGIETNGDPIDGEVSWKQSMPAYVYAADIQSSYIYAGIAARAAGVFQAYDAPAAARYRETALKAMTWAEADHAKRVADGSWAKLGGDVHDDRCLAALSLYRMTGDKRWNDVFLEETSLKDASPQPFYGNQLRRDIAFLYARLPQENGDSTLRANALKALVADADGSLAYEQGNAWSIASDDPGKPQFLGFYSVPHGAVSLLRAYYLTHSTKYLSGAVAACLFPDGANPGNIVYTSGVGANPIQHPLNLDSRLTGQPAPAGLTTYGNIDFARWGNQTWITWPITYYFGKQSKPSPLDWPTSEAYFDVFFMTSQNEFTMDQTMGPNAYVWGFLAARK